MNTNICERLSIISCAKEITRKGGEKPISDVNAQLKEHLENGKDWEKMDTPIPGVFVVKVPATKSRPSLLFLEVNPLKEDGNPMKRKGLYVGNQETLEKFADALQDDKVYHLIKEVEGVNPKSKSTSNRKSLKM